MHKDKSREEYVDVSKHAMHEETQQLIFGPRYEEPRKRRFWQRKPKEKET